MNQPCRFSSLTTWKDLLWGAKLTTQMRVSIFSSSQRLSHHDWLKSAVAEGSRPDMRTINKFGSLGRLDFHAHGMVSRVSPLFLIRFPSSVQISTSLLIITLCD